MGKLKRDQRETKHDPGHKEKKPTDVREAVEEQDRDRARRMEEWERRYGAFTNSKGDGQGRGETTITPFLLIRYSTSDAGVRPLPSGTPFWETPYIWVESSDQYGNAVAGEQNFLHALIFNNGAFQAAPVQVDFYWANPALGLGPANMNFVGTEWVEIGRLESKDVRCSTPWIPILVNEGHECVMVNCTCALSDPILNPFQPTLDRHVGQKNLHVMAGKAGKSIVYTLQITNIFPIEMPALVTAEFTQLMLTEEGHNVPLYQLGGLAATFATQEKTSRFRQTDIYTRDSHAHRISQRSAALERRSSISTPVHFTPLQGRGMAVTVDALGPRGTIQSGQMGRFSGDLLASMDMFREGRGGNPEGVVIEKLRLEPSSIQTIDVRVDVPADAEPGHIFITHLSHQAGPLTIGGYSIVVVIE